MGKGRKGRREWERRKDMGEWEEGRRGKGEKKRGGEIGRKG